MAMMAGLVETRVPSDPPMRYRVSGVELIADAKAEGRYRDPKTYSPQPGDLVILERGTTTDALTHTAVVIEPYPNGDVRAVGGNEGAGVWSALAGRTWKRSDVLAYIRLPGADAAPDATA
jgi:hypothetical protein